MTVNGGEKNQDREMIASDLSELILAALGAPLGLASFSHACLSLSWLHLFIIRELSFLVSQFSSPASLIVSQLVLEDPGTKDGARQLWRTIGSSVF
jgi:hypothetical protein